MSIVDFHELAFIGATTDLDFTGTTDRVELESSPIEPATYLLRSDQDVRVRQGDSSVTADADDDFYLTANTYLKIIITTTDNNNIAAITPTSGTNGTLQCTKLSDDTP